MSTFTVYAHDGAHPCRSLTEARQVLTHLTRVAARDHLAAPWIEETAPLEVAS